VLAPLVPPLPLTPALLEPDVLPPVPVTPDTPPVAVAPEVPTEPPVPDAASPVSRVVPLSPQPVEAAAESPSVATRARNAPARG